MRNGWMLAPCALLASCMGGSGGPGPLEPDLVVKSIQFGESKYLTPPTTADGPRTLQIPLTVKVRNQGNAVASGTFRVAVDLIQWPAPPTPPGPGDPSQSLLPQLSLTPPNVLTSPEPVVFKVQGGLDGKQTTTVGATVYLDLPWKASVEFVAKVDACQAGSPCKVKESDESNNTRVAEFPKPAPPPPGP